MVIFKVFQFMFIMQLALTADVCSDCQICDNAFSPARCYLCNNGFYLYQSSVYFICIQCSDECKKCEGDMRQCTECSDGYYMLIQNNCVTCNIPCSTCENNLGCLTCIDNYFIDGDQCSSCDSTCKTCEYSPNICTSCRNKYYLDTNNSCKQCPSLCSTCTKVQCLQCIENAQLPSCECKGGYYQNLSQCKQCLSICNTCQIQENNCLTCSGSNRNLYNLCSCYYGHVDILGVCQRCTLPCLTCQSIQEYCTSCFDSNMILNSGVCIFQQIDSYQSCHFKCKTCQNFDQCLSCQDVNHVLTKNKECICSIGYIEIADKCIMCQAPCFSCQINPQQCTECMDINQILIENTCVCSSGYHLQNQVCIRDTNQYCLEGQFLNNQNICTQCQKSCLSCEIFEFNCLSCKAQMTLTNNQCLCSQGHFYEDNQCKVCDPTCLSCVKDSSLCSSCDSIFNRVLHDYKCKCNKGYYESSELLCRICDDNTKQHKDCNYTDCDDGIWTWGEQCDDNNSIYKDGCTNCKLDRGYYCSNNILKPSKCFKCSQNCSKCSENLLCSKCDEGYFLENYHCFKRFGSSWTCQTFNQCTQCKYLELNSKCAYCDDKIGYSFDSDIQSCISVCGDNIQADIEKCDDGNKLNGDGCDNKCHLEQGYQIKNGIVQKINYPIPYLQEQVYEQNQLYNQTRLFTLFYESKLQILEVIFENLFQIYHEYDDQITIFDHSQIKINDYLIINLTIQVNLQQSMQNQLLNVYFINSNLIKNLEGFEQQIRLIKTSISNYEHIDQQTKDLTRQSIDYTYYMLYVILGMVLLSILFGGIDIFFNLLDMLQFIQYLFYINTQFPYNMNEYLHIFGFIQLQILNNYINYNQYIDCPLLELAPKKIANDYTPNIIVNLKSIMFIWIIFMLTYLWLTSCLFQQNKLKQESFRIIQKKKFISKKNFKLMQTNLEVFHVQRTFQNFFITSYDFCFFIILNLYVLSFDDLVNILASIITIICLLIYFLILIKSLNVVQQKWHVLKQRKNQWGSIYEGLQMKDRFKTYYNIYLLFKRLVLMLFLVFPYYDPLFQVTGIMILSIFQISYLCFKPINEQIELRKQLISEVYIFLILINILILVLDDYIKVVSRSIIGWICILLITLLLVVADIKINYFNIAKQFQMQFNSGPFQFRLLASQGSLLNTNLNKII